MWHTVMDDIIDEDEQVQHKCTEHPALCKIRQLGYECTCGVELDTSDSEEYYYEEEIAELDGFLTFGNFEDDWFEEDF